MDDLLLGSGFSPSRRRRRPRWGLKAHFIAALIVAGATTAVVLFLVDVSLWQRLEAVVLALFLVVFAYSWFVLYRGVRFDKRERFHLQWLSSDPSDFMVVGPDVTLGVFTEAGAEEGPLGCAVGFVLDVIVSVVLALLLTFVLWLGANLLVVSITALAIPVFFVFSRLLRLVVARGRKCCGNKTRALSHALVFAAVSSAWLYVVLYAAHQLLRVAGWMA
jgi:Ca2+/Na+ antiporter